MGSREWGGGGGGEMGAFDHLDDDSDIMKLTVIIRAIHRIYLSLKLH